MAYIRPIRNTRCRAWQDPSTQAVATLAVALAFVCACGSATDRTSTAKDTTEAGRVDVIDAAKAEGWQARSQAGLYRISIRPEQGLPRIGVLHAWLVQVESSAGEPVEPTQLAFDGGMPQHRHGFETSPRVTDSLGDGVFRVDGIRFHMPGAWTLRVDVAGPDGIYFALFDVEVGP
jgi:hypothetical protein